MNESIIMKSDNMMGLPGMRANFSEYDDNIIIKERILNRKSWNDVALHPHFQSKGFSKNQLQFRRGYLERIGKLSKYQEIGTTNSDRAFTLCDDKELIIQHSIHGGNWTYISQNCKKLSTYTPRVLKIRWWQIQKKQKRQQSTKYRMKWTEIEKTKLMEQIFKYRTTTDGVINWAMVADHPVLANRSIAQMKVKWAKLLSYNKNKEEKPTTANVAHHGNKSQALRKQKNGSSIAEGTHSSTPNSSGSKKRARVRANDVKKPSRIRPIDEIEEGKTMTLKVVFNTALGKKELCRVFEFESNDEDHDVLANAFLGRLWNVDGTEAFV